MKGIVFNLLEEVTVQHYGEDTWDKLLAAAGQHGAYTSLGSYPDAAILDLVDQASQMLGKKPFEVLRWFGQQAMPLLFKRYPNFFDTQVSTRSFLLSVNQIIHPEVRKIYPGAQVPTFEFFDGAGGELMMIYNSPRKLCALAQGFAEGAATHYNERITFEQIECMLRGNPRCLFSITFSPCQSS